MAQRRCPMAVPSAMEGRLMKKISTDVGGWGFLKIQTGMSAGTVLQGACRCL